MRRENMAPPPSCEHCGESHEGLNGLFCRKLRRYVEHLRVSPCMEEKAGDEGKKKLYV